MKRPFLYHLVQGLIVAGMGIGGFLIAFIAANGRLFGWPPLVANIHGDLRIYASGAIAILCITGCEYIAFLLYRMMRTLSKDPFVKSNVTALRKMGFAALAICLMCLATLLLIPVPLAAVAALPIGMCGLFSLVLSHVFADAVAYKEENDLTI